MSNSHMWLVLASIFDPTNIEHFCHYRQFLWLALLLEEITRTNTIMPCLFILDTTRNSSFPGISHHLESHPHLTNLSPGGEGDAFLIWLNRLLLHSLWNSRQGSIKSLQLSTSSESSLRLLALTERWLPSEDTASPWAFSSTGLFLLPNSTVLLTWTVG